MAVLGILKYPDPRLQRIARPVDIINCDIIQLVDDMLETMYAAPGVGLAATQVGALHRILVLDLDHDNPQKKPYKLINPAIVQSEGEIVWEEGCLSVVDFTAEVRRAAQVEVVALDENENEIKIDAEGLLAVALQHEIDHLDGKLFIDRISRLKRDLYTRKRRKMLRSGTAPSTVRTVADRHGIPVVAPEKIRDPDLLKTLTGWNPTIIVVVAYGRILPKTILDLAPYGCLNVHYSLLPKYRGAAPAAWTIINGESRAGVTTMKLVEKMDAGPTYLQE